MSPRQVRSPMGNVSLAADPQEMDDFNDRMGAGDALDRQIAEEDPYAKTYALQQTMTHGVPSGGRAHPPHGENYAKVSSLQGANIPIAKFMKGTGSGQQ